MWTVSGFADDDSEDGQCFDAGHHRERARDSCRQIASQLPPALQIQPISDQSIFVRGAISGVVREAVIAACLTAAMILIFLGSWRSTLIIAVSIPLSISCSLLMLVGAWRDDQHHDAGRPGAGGRHPGRRRDG